MVIRHDWTRNEIRELYGQPLLELIFQAQCVHRQHFKVNEVQKSTLLSIKTGGCPEDCGYCPQSAHYQTGLPPDELLSVETVLEKARAARANGSTRFCMGAAWREVKDNGDFEQVLAMVRAVADLGMEVCCTLGMLTASQAKRLAAAGLDYYNHNLDTSPEFYGAIITTRTYEDRLRTLAHVRQAGIRVCCGGIIGMGESAEDRIGLLENLATQKPHPESVPINLLVKVAGTPLATQAETSLFELVRTLATARLIMPASVIRLSAGRTSLSEEAQALCFLSGVNSIFAGDKLLTTPNPDWDDDSKLFEKLGLQVMSVRT